MMKGDGGVCQIKDKELRQREGEGERERERRRRRKKDKKTERDKLTDWVKILITPLTHYIFMISFSPSSCKTKLHILLPKVLFCFVFCLFLSFFI